MKKRDLGIAEN